jgi:hypothetical protein
MNEAFLHYIWQFQYFDKRDLLTTEGEQLEVFRQGIWNTDAGPDFFNAKIKIDSIEWAGSIEIHIKSSEWLEHHHDQDNAYENVILHVVWKDDKPVKRRDGSRIPTLQIGQRVNQNLLSQYRKLVESSFVIPCGKILSTVNEITKLSMLDKVLIERLELKSQTVSEAKKRNNNDWEETAYEILARNFGFKVNTDPFYLLSQSLPYKILLKHADHPIQVEALLFGVAGFLEGGLKDEYFTQLQKEFKVLSTKYKLEDKKLNPAQWRFLRLRPANFPTIRIAQFSSLIATNKNLFSKFIEVQSYVGLLKIFDIDQSDYWRKHYRFGKKSKSEVNDFGQLSKDNLIINSVIPLLVAYGIERGEQMYIDRAQEILQQMPAEANKITRVWNELEWNVKTAFDSQGLIQLYNNYCMERNCLNCSIGISVLRPNPAA